MAEPSSLQQDTPRVPTPPKSTVLCNPQIPNGSFFWHLEDPVVAGGPALVSVAEVMSGTAETVSLRLYYRPEDTPHGRSWRHGDDEILASRRQATLSTDAALEMVTESQKRGSVCVVSYRDYAREKALASRQKLCVPDEVLLAPTVTQFYVREDYRDPLLEARDHVEDVIDI